MQEAILIINIQSQTKGFTAKSSFLSNGDVYVASNEQPSGEAHNFTIHLDYKQLYADCNIPVPNPDQQFINKVEK